MVILDNSEEKNGAFFKHSRFWNWLSKFKKIKFQFNWVFQNKLSRI